MWNPTHPAVFAPYYQFGRSYSFLFFSVLLSRKVLLSLPDFGHARSSNASSTQSVVVRGSFPLPYLTPRIACIRELALAIWNLGAQRQGLVYHERILDWISHMAIQMSFEVIVSHSFSSHILSRLKLAK
jgi:hypothetical protein